MLQQEFELLSGIYPTSDLYAFIEQAYNEFDGDKGAFCEAYRANRDGLAETIRSKCDLAHAHANAAAEQTIAELGRRINDLQFKLDREQEWRPYECERNVSQTDYARLASCVREGSDSHYMTDDEAKDWIYREYGFAREMVTIFHEVDVEEINRHSEVRKAGRTYDRRPVYDATDYHYIRFNTPHWKYEVWNGMLYPFY